MTLELNGWDMHDINVKLRNKTVFEILCMYKDKVSEITLKSQEYMQAMRDKNETAKERIEKECDHLEKEKCVIAIQIADVFSKESK